VTKPVKFKFSKYLSGLFILMTLVMKAAAAKIYLVDVWIVIRRAVLVVVLLSGLMVTTPSSVFGTQSVTLAWSPITNADLAGYTVYYGSVSHTYTNMVSVGNVTSATISGLVEGGTYYFAARALSTSGLESDYSDEVSYTVPNTVPLIQVTPGSIAYGTMLVGTRKMNSFVVANTGSGTLSGTASVGGPFSIISGGSYSLGANASQTVTVVFNPTVAGNYSQNVNFSGGGGANATVSGSVTNASSVIVTPPSPKVITKKVTASITNPITLQFKTNLSSPTWQTIGAFTGSINVSFTNTPAVFFRGVCSNLTGSVTLTWPPSTDLLVVGYKVYYGTASGAYSSVINVGNVTKATISNLTGGVVYYFTIRTYSVLGLVSSYSSEISAIPQTTNFSLTVKDP
jgi:hypothetical protein